MRIYTTAGDLPFRLFTFPDGQPHFELLAKDEWHSATIEAAITSPAALVDVLLAKETLDASGYVTSLDLRYLMGGRMDRRISQKQPHTLAVIGRTLALAGFYRVRVLDPHSDATLTAINAEAVYPLPVIAALLQAADPAQTVVIAPDAGATPRVDRILQSLGYADRFRVVHGIKHRDSQTGALSGFGVQDASAVDGKECLILDDICDGGGTFIGLAEQLHAAGARHVDLFVTHGIFSKGVPLKGIRFVHSTDSFPRSTAGGLSIWPLRMSDL